MFGPPNVKELKAKGDIKGLIKALRYKKNYLIRAEAADSLGETGDERAVHPLIDALKDENKHVRKVAAEALGKIGDKQAVEPLIAALKDKEGHVRETATSALGKIGDLRAVEPLIVALKDIYARGNAAEALGNIGDARAVEPLIDELKNRFIIGDSEDRVKIAEALAKIGDVRAVVPLVEVLEHMDKFFIKTEESCEKIAEALIRIGAPAVEPLIAALESSNSLSKSNPAVASALRKLGDPRAKKVLDRHQEIVAEEKFRELMTRIVLKKRKTEPKSWESGARARYENYDDAIYAIRELGDLGDTRAVPELCKRADEYHDWEYERPAEYLGRVRPDSYSSEVLWALGKIGGPLALKFLLDHWECEKGAMPAAQALHTFAVRHGLSTETVQRIDKLRKYHEGEDEEWRTGQENRRKADPNSIESVIGSPYDRQLALAAAKILVAVSQREEKSDNQAR